MPNTDEIIRDSINDFSRVQRHMKLAKKENATEAYWQLSKKCLFSKDFRSGICGFTQVLHGLKK